jgi:hypothetical protein
MDLISEVKTNLIRALHPEYSGYKLSRQVTKRRTNTYCKVFRGASSTIGFSFSQPVLGNLGLKVTFLEKVGDVLF